MTVFEAARSVSAIDAARKLGIPVKRTGKRAVARCVFHADRTPSMVLYPEDKGFHCFGCGAHGDAIALYGQMHRLKPLDAARKLCDDFGLFWTKSSAPPVRRPDPKRLNDRLLAFRERQAAFWEDQRHQAQLRMNIREEQLCREKVPFDEWWDDPQWASAKADEVQAAEELASLMDMSITELWHLYQNTKEEHNERKYELGRTAKADGR